MSEKASMEIIQLFLTRNEDLYDKKIIDVFTKLGNQEHAPILNTIPGGYWQLWHNITKQDPSFGHPDKFCTNIKKNNWESATITTLDSHIPPYIERICKRNPFSDCVATGGIITVKDSSWMMSYTLNRQPHLKEQPKDPLVVWVYELFTDVPVDYINKKPTKECTSIEITEEWLYHLRVPKDQIHDMATLCSLHDAICHCVFHAETRRRSSKSCARWLCELCIYRSICRYCP